MESSVIVFEWTHHVGQLVSLGPNPSPCHPACVPSLGPGLHRPRVFPTAPRLHFLLSPLQRLISPLGLTVEGAQKSKHGGEVKARGICVRRGLNKVWCRDPCPISVFLIFNFNDQNLNTNKTRTGRYIILWITNGMLCHHHRRGL